MKIAVQHAPDFGDSALGNSMQRCQQGENGVIGKPVIDEFAVASCSHHADASHVLQMLRGVGNRKPSPLREDFDAALALCNLLQQFEPVGVPERFGDCGKLGE